MDPLARNADPALLHPTVRALVSSLLRELQAEGIPLALYEGARTPERQVELYKRGRVAGYGPLGHHATYDTAWTSRHQYGMAVDLVFRKPGSSGSWTWAEPSPGAWKRYQEIAARIGLQALKRANGSVIEWPHVQHPWPLVKLRNGEYPAGGDASWADNLNASIFRWGPRSRRIAAVDHPAAPPRVVLEPDRPHLDADVFPPT